MTNRVPSLPAAAAVKTISADQTRDLAAHLATVARAGDRLALIGPLGAGKTQFAKGFARGLGVTEVVNSPSFTLMAEYAGRLPLFHQDLYRLSSVEEAFGGGMVDERQLEGVTLTEWAERLPAEVDPERLTIRLDVLAEEERRITIEPGVANDSRYVHAAQEWQRTR